MPQSSNLRAAIGLQHSPADMVFAAGFPKGQNGKKKKKDMIGQRGRQSHRSEYMEQKAAGTLPPSYAPPSSKAPSTADSSLVKKLTRQVGNRDKKIEVLTKKLRSATKVGTYEKKCHKDTIKDCEKNHVKIPGGVPTTNFSDLKTDEERQAVVTQLQTAYQDLVQKLGMTPNEAKVAQLYWDSVYGILSASTDPTPTTSTCTNYTTTTTDAVTTGASTSTTPLPPNHFENVFFNAGPTTSNTTTSPRNPRHTHVRRTHTVTGHPAQPVHGNRTALMDEEWEKLMRIRSIADEISISDNALRRIFIAAGTLSGCHTSSSSTSSSSITIISIAVIITISMTIITTIIIIIIVSIIVSIIITLHEFVMNSSE